MTSNRLPHSLVLATAKGGVGKTTISANLAAVAAARGRQVVVVDLDAQGNLGSDLGVDDHDQGQGLLDAALGGSLPRLFPTGRQGLSLIPGGEATARRQVSADPARLPTMLLRALAPVTEGAQVIIDTAPSAVSPLADAALRVARWLLIPTRCDRKSLAGIPTMLARVVAAPPSQRVQPVGIVLFDVPARATAIVAETRQQLQEQLGGAFPVLAVTIRSAVKAQRDASNVGIVAAEYAAIASRYPTWIDAPRHAKPKLSFARNARALASDYQRLSDEIEQLTIEKERP